MQNVSKNVIDPCMGVQALSCTKFKIFVWKIVQMGTLQKLQNSIQTLIIFWPVYPIHTNSLFWVIFVELPFCNFPPPNASICGKDSKI